MCKRHECEPADAIGRCAECGATAPLWLDELQPYVPTAYCEVCWEKLDLDQALAEITAHYAAYRERLEVDYAAA
jgi:hypothetical protein